MATGNVDGGSNSDAAYLLVKLTKRFCMFGDLRLGVHTVSAQTHPLTKVIEIKFLDPDV